jgi:thiamine-monophosphate kinase
MPVSSELVRLERLARIFGSFPPADGVTVAIGDDAAVLAPGAGSLVWTIDSAVEGVHFRRDWLSLEDLGWRSFMAAASDLAAMGARPRGALSALALPAGLEDDELEAIARGQAQAAQAVGTAVIGGNLSRAGELSVTTTLLGEAERPLRRQGGRSGSILALAGELGLARGGVEALTRGIRSGATERAVQAWRRPRARIEEGRAAGPHAQAAIDVSDGLAIDAFRMALASGIAIRLSADAILRAMGPALAEIAGVLGLDPLDLALHGGEDYALIACFPPSTPPPGFIPIGTCTEGQGIMLEATDGTLRSLAPEGYDHFG